MFTSRSIRGERTAGIYKAEEKQEADLFPHLIAVLHFNLNYKYFRGLTVAPSVWLGDEDG